MNNFNIILNEKELVKFRVWFTNLSNKDYDEVNFKVCNLKISFSEYFKRFVLVNDLNNYGDNNGK